MSRWRRWLSRSEEYVTPRGRTVTAEQIDELLESPRLTLKQLEAIGSAASIVGRMGSAYETYGGVDIDECMAQLNSIGDPPRRD